MSCIVYVVTPLRTVLLAEKHWCCVACKLEALVSPFMWKMDGYCSSTATFYTHLIAPMDIKKATVAKSRGPLHFARIFPVLLIKDGGLCVHNTSYVFVDSCRHSLAKGFLPSRVLL